jgi:endonuclease YncB( thermonuclease family)
MRALLCILLVIVSCGTVAAEPIDASAIRVIDGDTIRVGRTVYRLVGFDAPETRRSVLHPRAGTRVAGEGEASGIGQGWHA